MSLKFRLRWGGRGGGGGGGGVGGVVMQSGKTHRESFVAGV